MGCPADLECQALVAEQARELAHRLRSPLGAIDLVCETLVMEQPDSALAERMQVVLRASAKLKQALDETVSAAVPRWPARQRMDLADACARFAEAEGLDYAATGQGPIWIAAAAPDGELALWQALTLVRLGARNGQVRLDLAQVNSEQLNREFRRGTDHPASQVEATGQPVELSLTPKHPHGPLDHRLDGEVSTNSLAHLRLKRLRRFAAEQDGALVIEPSRLLLRLRTVAPPGGGRATSD